MPVADDPPRFGLDDLHRLASALGASAGLPPARAAMFATHLLWYDTAGLPEFGVASLPSWLEKVEAGAIDPRTEGVIDSERSGTAVLDARGGLPPLVLARGGEIAGEKAREVGVGVVRVVGLGPEAGPASCAAAEVAIGPTAVLIVGPRPSWTLALPSAGGLPFVIDTGLESHAAGGKPRSRPKWAEVFAPWAEAMTTGTGWLVVALAIPAFEPLAAFHDRIAPMLDDARGPGLLLPTPWETLRREARERGVPVRSSALDDLRRRAGAIGQAMPEARAVV